MSAAAPRTLEKPTPPPSLRARGIEARRRGDHRQALQHFRAALAETPDDPRLHHEIASAALATGALQEAEDAYRAALRAEPHLVDAMRGLGHCARRRGDRHAALASFEAALAFSDEPPLKFEAALERIALGGEEEAALADLLAAPATRARACFEIGRSRQRKGDLAGARLWLGRAVEADPTDRATRRALAALLTEGWALEAAASLYDDLLRTGPDDVEALLGRGALARRQGCRDIARRSFEAAFRLDPARGTVEWAREERDAGAPDRARALLERLQAQRPADASLTVQLGLTARAEGDREAALRHFDEALRLEPGHLSANVERAADLHRLGRSREARATLARALERWPDHPRLLEALGDLAVAADEIETALDLFARAAAAEPSPPSPAIKMARCQAAGGAVADALATLDALASAAGPSPDVTMARAQILKEAGLLSEAARAYRDGLAAFPTNFALWLQARLFAIDWQAGADAGEQATAPAATPAEFAKAKLASAAAAAAGWRFGEAQAWCRAALVDNASDGATHIRLAQAALAQLDLGAVERHLVILSRLEAPTKRLRGQATGRYQSLLGQIFEEARLDVQGLAHLLVAGSLPDEIRLAGFLASVQTAPDMTLASMQAAIALRQGGFLAALPREGAGTASPIPPTIVQFWHEEDLPPDLQRYADTWRACNPDFAYRRFSATGADAFIARDCDAVVGKAFARARDPAAKADLFRLAYLVRRGGVYADIDDRCLASLAGLRAGGKALVLYQEDIGSIGNDVMAAAPGHPLLERALALACDAVLRGDSDIPWLSTGPGLLTRVVMSAVAADGVAALSRNGIAIVARRELLALIATGCMTAYKHTRRHWSRAAFTVPRRASPPPLPRSHAAKDPQTHEHRSVV